MSAHFSVFVQLISATWCKRCVELKPRIKDLCRIAGASFEEINYDELDEEDPLKMQITSLPTIRLRLQTTEWKNYTAKDFSMWEEQMLLHAQIISSASDLDF